MPEKNVESSRTQGSGAQSQEQAKQQGERQQRGTSGTLQTRSYAPIAGAFGLSPFSLVRRMMEDMDRMLEGFGGAAFRGLPQLWSPPIETFERDGRFVLRAELPGLSPDDVRVEVQDDALILEGERKSEFEAEEKGAWRSERAYGRFSRTIPLPDGAQADKAEARFENGVLEVSIPVQEDSNRRRRIEIQGASKGGSSVH
jgi:HSP20 family protein